MTVLIFADSGKLIPNPVFSESCLARSNTTFTRLSLPIILSVFLLIHSATIQVAHAAGIVQETSASSRHVDVNVDNELSSPGRRRSARAQALLGFRYEHGLGKPQAYVAAADLYARAAGRGDSFGQNRLGLMYDKGHGVPQNFVLAYKWLSIAAARASRREREIYLRLRDAVSSKMTPGQISEGQWMALNWQPER